jgi:hypothetical protein
VFTLSFRTTEGSAAIRRRHCEAYFAAAIRRLALREIVVASAAKQSHKIFAFMRLLCHFVPRNDRNIRIATSLSATLRSRLRLTLALTIYLIRRSSDRHVASRHTPLAASAHPRDDSLLNEFVLDTQNWRFSKKFDTKIFLCYKSSTFL